jgi:hypothetical protein
VRTASTESSDSPVAPRSSDLFLARVRPTWSVWLRVSVAANILLALVLGGLVLNFISLPPILAELHGNSIMTSPNPAAWKTTIELFSSLGDGPAHTTHNPDVVRAFMRNGEIINLPTPELHERLGLDVVASRFFVVEDPRAEAERAVKFLQDRGYEAHYVINAERHISPGAMAFVVSNAFPGWSVVLRKPAPDMGEPLEPWNDNLLQ